MASEAKLKKMVILPCDLPRWNEIKAALNHLGDVGTIEELESGLSTLYCLVHSEPESGSGDTNGNYCNAGDDIQVPFPGLIYFLMNTATQKEKSTFFWRVLPMMATLAAEIETLKPAGGLQYSKQQEGK